MIKKRTPLGAFFWLSAIAAAKKRVRKDLVQESAADDDQQNEENQNGARAGVAETAIAATWTDACSSDGSAAYTVRHVQIPFQVGWIISS